MADIGDRDRGGRRRRRRGARKPIEFEREMAPQITKPTMILAKPPSERNQNQSNGNLIDSLSDFPGLPNGLAASPGTPGMKQPIVMIKTREEPRSSDTVSTSVQSIPSLLAGEGAHRPSPDSTRQSGQDGSHIIGSSSKLASPPEMTQALKLVDDCLQWCDNGLEMLQDQTDFLVVGVIGPQGVGKSTIMSVLAGNDIKDPYRNFAFRPENREVREAGSHQTVGVDMFVTGERMILLDTQPILSAAVLDHMIHGDRKYPAEYTSAENCIEMQSLQITSFMLTVCNLILVVMDWFVDISLIRFLQTAEMLKPATPTPPPESGIDDTQDYQPHVVFVLNKAERDDFSPHNIKDMTDLLERTMRESKLKYKGPVSHSSNKSRGGNPDVNLFMLPVQGEKKKDAKEGNGNVVALLQDYRGHPTYRHLIKTLRNQIFSAPRSLLTHTTLTEKNWFHYAARTWETVKKSSLISEYNRLMP